MSEYWEVATVATLSMVIPKLAPLMVEGTGGAVHVASVGVLVTGNVGLCVQ